MTHTPTPWSIGHSMERNYIYGGGSHLACIGSRENGFFIHDDGSLNESEANAAFIVRAVNSHDDLLEALETLLALDTDGEAGCRIDPIEYGRALAMARAAVAKARGETK